MQQIVSESDLRKAILQLERQRTDEGKLLKEKFMMAYASVKPMNLIKSTLTDLIAPRNLTGNILNTSVGMTAGYIAKKLFERGTKNLFKKVMGNALMFGIIKLIVNNPETVKSLGQGFLKIIRTRHRKRVHSL